MGRLKTQTITLGSKTREDLSAWLRVLLLAMPGRDVSAQGGRNPRTQLSGLCLPARGDSPKPRCAAMPQTPEHRGFRLLSPPTLSHLILEGGISVFLKGGFPLKPCVFMIIAKLPSAFSFLFLLDSPVAPPSL